MTTMNEQVPAPANADAKAAPATARNGAPRAYEQSGLYPADGKPFRLWALLGWLTLVIVGLAVAAALLNIYYLGAPWKAG